jgi:2-polyprenyl-3-methyl-5-hydroxy-6-metoxy-1,4-benzoquinol methylase
MELNIARPEKHQVSIMGSIVSTTRWYKGIVAKDTRAPYIQENLWGYGKRLRFVDQAMQREFPGRKRCELTVLDLGCGNGSQLAIPLADAGYRVTAMDPHWPSIERGRRLSSAVNFLHGVVSDLSLSKFDCVIISEVLEHLAAPEALLGMAIPHLTESGILIITVPNGYGEFELDRGLYQALHVDKLVAWLWSVFKGDQYEEVIGGSDDESPHIQRFTLPRLRKIFKRNRLWLVEARGTSLASGPFVLHLLGRFETFVRLNAAIVDRLPLWLAGGWMFCLRLAQSPASCVRPRVKRQSA